jgi:dGTPase
VPLVRRHVDAVDALYPSLSGRRRVHETIRRMINEVAGDVVTSSAGRLKTAAPRDIDAVRLHSGPLIGLSDGIREQHLELKRFLREHVYRHHRVLRMTSKARRVLKELFATFMGDTRLMPVEYFESAARAEARDGLAGKARIVSDYIAGMTDRYAILEHRRLFDPAERT